MAVAAAVRPSCPATDAVGYFWARFFSFAISSLVQRRELKLGMCSVPLHLNATLKAGSVQKVPYPGQRSTSPPAKQTRAARRLLSAFVCPESEAQRPTVSDRFDGPRPAVCARAGAGRGLGPGGGKPPYRMDASW